MLSCHHSGDQVTNNMACSSVGTWERAALSQNTLREVGKNSRTFMNPCILIQLWK